MDLRFRPAFAAAADPAFGLCQSSQARRAFAEMPVPRSEQRKKPGLKDTSAGSAASGNPVADLAEAALVAFLSDQERAEQDLAQRNVKGVAALRVEP